MEDPYAQQTILILPIAYVRKFTAQHKASFQERTIDSLELTMVGQAERAVNKLYKLEHVNGSYWVSIPRKWLKNIGARKDDWLDVYSTDDPLKLIVQYRKALSTPK